MLLKMKKYAAILYTSSILLVSNNYAHADFIKYKRYLIPVAGGSCESRAIPSNAPSPNDSGKARVFVTTDIDVNRGDPDDIQSLAHILAFADKVDIEGFSTSDPGDSNSINSGVNDIYKGINAYAKDVAELRSRNRGSVFPDANILLSSVYKGIRTIGNKNGGGWGESDGANAIVSAIRCKYQEGDRRPLYVLNWGASSEVVRALEKAPDIAKYIRVVSYSDHNNEGRQAPVNDYLRRVAKNSGSGGVSLWWIDYPVGNSTKPLARCEDSITNNIKNNGGDLGRTIKDNRDLKCSGHYGQKGFKLGDTITTMFVFHSASTRKNPRTAYWGRYSRPDASRPNHWVLEDRSFKNKSRVYSTWNSRVSGLRRN